MAQPSPLILCPMHIEFAAVRRALRAATLEHSARLVRTGVGKDAILRSLRDHAQRQPTSLAILAGVCGALRHVPDRPAISRVIDQHGHTWSDGVGFDPAGVTLIAVDQIVATPADKAALAQRSGAAIVDMESHAFAAACRDMALPWTVIRGVSDTPEETLPAQVIHWIRPDGTTIVARAALDMLRAPTLIPHIVGVVRRSNRVLPLVAAQAVQLARAALPRGSTAPSLPA